MTNIILRRPKLGRATKHVVEQAAFLDKVVRNDKPLPPNLNYVFRWGTTTNVNATHIVNSAGAIHKVNDKAGFRRILMAAQRPGEAPLSPFTVFSAPTPADEANGLVWPLVVRPQTHAQGKHVYKVNNQAELAAAAARCGGGWYAANYINKVAEYRVTFVQGRVVWVARKTPGNPEDVAWNVARGGRFDNVRFDEWPLKAIRISREAFLLSSLDFGAVDVMVDGDGNAYVLEINSAPSQTSPYRQSCMAKAFDYIIANGAAPIGVTQDRGGWKKFVHPAVSEEAIMV